MSRFAVNDCVIYHQPEVSAHPRTGARDVTPAEHGESYSYVVDRFLRVVRVHADGTLEAVGQGGDVHRVAAADPLLEKAGWWNRLIRRRFFPGV